MKFDISMLIPGMPFDGETVQNQSLGGSESAGYYMALNLAKLGNRVTVFCNTPQPSSTDGVLYLPASQYGQFASQVPHDATIVQRAPEAFSGRLSAKLNLLWCHDLALKRQEAGFKGVLWNVDKTLLLSDYMVAQYKEVYGLTDEFIYQTRNGVDLALYEKRASRVCRQKAILYCARPERGLDNLLAIYPLILERHPDCELWIAGYNNQSEQWADFYRAIEHKASQLGDRVKALGFLSKPQLSEAMSQAMVYAYPTPSPAMKNFNEVSCITAMECQAAGLPMVTSHRGAMPETLHSKACKTVDLNPWDEGYAELFADSVCDYLENEACWHRSHEAGLRHASTLGWDGVAREWHDSIDQWLREKSSSVGRNFAHLVKHDDIVTARHIAKRDKSGVMSGILSARPAQRSQYLPIDIVSALNQVRTCPRMGAYDRWLQSAAPKNVLDVACSWGGYTIEASARHPEVSFSGVDVDKGAVDLANKVSDETGSRVTFGLPASARRTHDGLVMMEVLEHLEAPWAFVDKQEAHCEIGAKVFITVPYGPWKDTNHLWAFDHHDLSDMFSGKADLEIHAMPHHGHTSMGEPLGWWVITYTVNGSPAQPVDIERKLRYLSPSQTLSVMSLVGPGAEANLHWCLRSIKDIADEIILADCGMSEEARRIAEQYPVKIIPCDNPLEVGFDAARNTALDACTMDWVLWIDTDEHLLDPENIRKYLREGFFNGFSIRQHNFATDVTWKPDMPVRLFRNRPYQGKTMRFWGVCHEHPELELNEGPGPTIVAGDLHLAHLGYLIESGRQKRFFRNYDLVQRDKEKYPERKLQKHFLMRDNVILAGYRMQQNGGRVDSEVARLCEDAVTLYQEHFLGQNSFIGVDSLHYYSQALKILGRGLDCSFGLQALPAGMGGDDAIRFASKEDFIKELSHKADASVGEITHEYW